MKVLVSYSGGKDSQACLIEAVKKYGADKVEAVFCDTGWEHPDTYNHIKETVNALDVKLTILKANRDFVELARHKGRFPSTKARFCTEELKIKPMIDFIIDQTESCIIIQGIRSAESFARAQMEDECMYFKGYYHPIETNTTRLIKYKNKLNKKITDKQRSDILDKISIIEDRISKGKEDPKYYTYRKKEVFKWCEKHDASVYRPIKSWSSQNVIDCILNAGFKPNILYYRGFSRVGCFPCVMCGHNEIKQLIEDIPMKQRLLIAENKIGRSFFPPDYIPKYACKNGKYPMVEDVFRYISDKNLTGDMFEPEEGYSCMSVFHGLCE